MKPVIILVTAGVVLGIFSMTLFVEHNETNVLPQARLVELMASDRSLLLLDVRTAKEFTEGHIPGAINIPHELLSARSAELGNDKSRQIVVYCQSGYRAGVAEEILRAAGFSQLQHLQGDMRGWSAAGRQVSKSTAASQ